MHDVPGDTSKDEPGQTRSAACSHDDQIGFPRARCGKKLGRGVTVASIGFSRQSGTREPGCHLAGEFVELPAGGVCSVGVDG
jgi:hypothetical protein